MFCAVSLTVQNGISDTVQKPFNDEQLPRKIQVVPHVLNNNKLWYIALCVHCIHCVTRVGSTDLISTEMCIHAYASPARLNSFVVGGGNIVAGTLFDSPSAQKLDLTHLHTGQDVQPSMASIGIRVMDTRFDFTVIHDKSFAIPNPCSPLSLSTKKRKRRN